MVKKMLANTVTADENRDMGKKEPKKPIKDSMPSVVSVIGKMRSPQNTTNHARNHLIFGDVGLDPRHYANMHNMRVDIPTNALDLQARLREIEQMQVNGRLQAQLRRDAIRKQKMASLLAGVNGFFVTTTVFTVSFLITKLVISLCGGV